MGSSLLDTDILSEVMRGRDHRVLERARACVREYGRLTISAVTVVEIVKGFERLRRDAEIARFLSTLDVMEVLPLGSKVAAIAGRIYGTLERSGQPIGRMDPMIAATAIVHELELVTGNVSHYERLARLGFELPIANWREG